MTPRPPQLGWGSKGLASGVLCSVRHGPVLAAAPAKKDVLAAFSSARGWTDGFMACVSSCPCIRVWQAADKREHALHLWFVC